MEGEEEKKSSSKQKYSRWYDQKFYQYAVGILLVLSILYIFHQVAAYFSPFANFISTLFMPLLISLLFYYLLRPVVNRLESYKVPRIAGILLIYLVIAILLILFVSTISPILVKQIKELANTSVETINKAETSHKYLFFNFIPIDLHDEIQKNIVHIFQQITTSLSQNFVDFLGYITRIAAVLAVIPFIVFYLLKDDNNFTEGFLNFVPKDYVREAKKILHNIDKTLSHYINGVVIVSSSLGLLLFISYLIIGLDYALILSVIALVLTTIPFLGPFLAIAPAIFVALSQSPLMVLKVVIVFVIIQQTESSIISPQIIGQRLHIHPLTIILLILAVGSLYGFAGVIFATPLYAISKVVIENLYKIYQLRFMTWKKKKKLSEN